jgi:hypothetical protein
MVPRKWLLSYRLLSARLRGEAQAPSARTIDSSGGSAARGQTQPAHSDPVEAAPPERALRLTAGRKP